MKTLVRFVIVVLSCSVVLAAEPQEQDRQAEIVALEAQLKELREQIPVISERADLARELADQKMVQAELTLLDAREKLDKVKAKSSGIRVGAPQPHPVTFQFGQNQQRIMVVPGADTDLQQVQEDLTVMSRILAKQLHEQGLAAWSWPNAHSIEAMSIDGYGAMFIVPVNFPLMNQPDEETEVVDEDADTLWLETRKEVTTPTQEVVVVAPNFSSKSAYDADKVERLKRTLCSSLKHASNIRSVQGSEWVVLVVNADSGNPAMNVYGGSNLFFNGAAASSAGSLLIKAGKADIDRFAAQQIDLGEFQDKVQIRIFAQP